MATSDSSQQQNQQEKPYYKDYPRYKVAIVWCIEYLKGLANLHFSRYMMVQVLPGVYGLIMAALLLSLAFFSYIAFTSGVGYGLYFLFIIAPVTFLVVASLVRAVLEFYQVVFRISENLDQLVGIRDTVDRLSNISDTVDQVVRVTRHVPFWGLLSGKAKEEAVIIADEDSATNGQPSDEKSNKNK